MIPTNGGRRDHLRATIDHRHFRDHQAVLATTAIGLAVIPAHPALFALRMRAPAHDRGGIKTEYHAFLRAEQSDPLTDGSTDRDLERLYNTLIGRDTDRRKAAS